MAASSTQTSDFCASAATDDAERGVFEKGGAVGLGRGQLGQDGRVPDHHEMPGVQPPGGGRAQGGLDEQLDGFGRHGPVLEFADAAALA